MPRVVQPLEFALGGIEAALQVGNHAGVRVDVIARERHAGAFQGLVELFAGDSGTYAQLAGVLGLGSGGGVVAGVEEAKEVPALHRTQVAEDAGVPGHHAAGFSIHGGIRVDEGVEDFSGVVGIHVGLREGRVEGARGVEGASVGVAEGGEARRQGVDPLLRMVAKIAEAMREIEIANARNGIRNHGLVLR